MNLQDIFKEEKENILGLSSELKGLFTYQKFNFKNKPIIFVTSTLYEANKYYQIIRNYTDKVCLFPMDDFLTSEALATSPELMTSRLETLSSLKKDNKIVVTNLMGLLRYLPQKEEYYNSFLEIEVGKDYVLNKIVQKLVKIGYKRDTIVDKTGEIAVRGFVLDIFPVNYENPIRLEFWGDTIESISEFDIDTQLTTKKLNKITITPNTEFICKEDVDEPKQKNLIKYTSVKSIIDYLDDPIIIYNDYNNILNSYNLLQDEIEEYNKNNDLPLNTKYMNELSTKMCKTCYYLSEFHNKATNGSSIDYKSKEIPNFTGSIEDINKKLNSYIKANKTVVICLSSQNKIVKMVNDLNNSNVIIASEDDIIKNKINIINKNIQEGFMIDNYVVISEKEIFNKKENNYSFKTNFKMGVSIKDINKLSIGDYVVHSIHGIGIYRGIRSLNKNGLKKDYITIEYRDEDKVYIPVEKIDMIKKFSSNEGRIPKLNKLGTSEWKKTKERVKAKVESIAGELLELYSKRESMKGYAFSKDSDEQLIFEKEFPYEETLDQLKVTEEIKKDMEKERPMDRLLCGDVGYGKTEVAFRAIFKAIMDGKQTVILCPTTILSSQHYQNAIERFKTFPANITLLNRFVSKKEQTRILNELEEGKIDLLIGTHRLLSDDVKFKNLGLLVIDEEQRFGVKHKEKIKQYKNNVDVLTLTATPIPRTLQMSMAGIRSLSLITTPPVNRYPVQTYVIEENKQLIKDAIYKELSRNGQTFILFNDIANMDVIVSDIQMLVPEAKIVSAHGRMDKNKLEKVMMKFQNKEYDVLICTTIIETGIDIPSVNTLIIYDADHFGLSQLYQIRGRVGRSNKIAYCYLMYNKGKSLSDIAKKRLNVIKDFTQLGSGFAIAMRDLSIRGAGDILGSEQAGFIDSVGVELFLSMLNEEVDKLKGKTKEENEEKLNPIIEVSTSIDDNYVSEEELKIEIHKKISEIDSKDKLNKVKEELEDRFGKLSEDVIIYMYEQLLEHTLSSLKINDVRQTKNSIIITIPQSLISNINGDDLFMNTISLSRSFRFSMVNNQLKVTLDIVNLDKHFIYYLIDFVDILKNALIKE